MTSSFRTWVEIDHAALQAIAQSAPEHADMLRQLVDASRALGEQASFAVLVEYLRNIDDFSQIIREIAEGAEMELDACRLELRAAVRKTKSVMLEQAMADLINSGLPANELRERYLQIQQQINQLRQQTEQEKGQR